LFDYAPETLPMTSTAAVCRTFGLWRAAEMQIEGIGQPQQK
jgi:hypothetical protein